MPQFFITPDSITDGRCTIRGTDFRHLVRVRRVREGDIIPLRMTAGGELSARIVVIAGDSLIAEIIDKKEPPPVLLKVTLCAALLKGKKFDTVIQKAVEIGVARIVPFESARTIPDLGEKREERRGRWQRIADEASKQCLGSSLVPVDAVQSFDEAILRCPGCARILAHPDRGAVGIREYRTAHPDASDAAILVGPEGGFTPEEIARAESNGWGTVNFGFTQMRAETAAMVLPALVIYEWSSR
ncbi:MAG: 16S rRNA (uracil(1498)-N(3))-methyltransferase [Spirochaetes bacterium]|nr:MAG: 16S rRNA (uracil(1498)-N(3))-methyltransferase [Spirochaetota bacterium]